MGLAALLLKEGAPIMAKQQAKNFDEEMGELEAAAVAAPPQPVPEQPIGKPNFREGRATFFSSARQQVAFPLGDHRIQQIPTLTGPRDTLVPAPVVEFNNHVYHTDDMDVVLAMTNSKRFGENRGWSIAPECLPAKVGQLWPTLHTDNQKAVVTALARGASEDDAIAVIDKSLGREDKARIKVAAVTPSVCPFCGEMATDADGSPMAGAAGFAAVRAHVTLCHPDEDF